MRGYLYFAPEVNGKTLSTRLVLPLWSPSNKWNSTPGVAGSDDAAVFRLTTLAMIVPVAIVNLYVD